MLGIGTAVSVPAIVRNIHQNLRAAIGELANFVREHRFVAYENSDLLVTGLERIARRAAGEIADFFGEAAGKAKQAFEGNVFAEWNQVDLVVASVPIAIRGYERRRIENVCGLLL